jgi:hypothetical protein
MVFPVSPLEGVVDAGVAGARADRAELLQRSRALGLPVEDVVLLEDDVAVEADVLSGSLKNKL